MKARSVLVSLIMCFIALTWCVGQDAMMGTWKLNEAKSKIGAGSPKNNTVVIDYGWCRSYWEGHTQRMDREV